MSDPLSVTASLISVLGLAGQAMQYLKDVKQGSSDRTRLRDELRNAVCLVEMLKDRVEDSEESGLQGGSIASLMAPDGPLHLFQSTLETVIAKLVPQERKRLTQPLKWPFDKQSIEEILRSLERQKTYFTLILQSDLITLSQYATSKINQVNNRVADLATRAQNAEDLQILRWISPLSFHSKHLDLRERRLTGTGKWLLESEPFLKWVQGDAGVLWCPGIPGAGKTMLVSMIIDYLDNHLSSSDAALAYIYCDYSAKAEQTTVNLASSILRQLLETHDSLPPEVVSLYQLHKKYGTRPNLTQVIKLLQQALSSYRLLYIVIDALDECSESSALQIVSEIRALGSHVRLLSTSRPSTSIESIFDGATRLEISAREVDIRLFLEDRLAHESRLGRHVQSDPSLKKQIIDTIIGEAQGMFLLAKLHFESLTRKLSRKDVRSALKSLPKTLDDTYQQSLARIRSQAEEDVDLAETILFWVVCAHRPLTVHELQHMFATRGLLDSEAMTLEEDDLPDKEILTAVCGGLVVVDKETQSVRLVHYTAKQYFDKIYQEQLMSTRFDLMRISIAYIRLQNFSCGICSTDEMMLQRLHTFPFLDYTARYWGYDANHIPLDDIWPELQAFFYDRNALDVVNQAFSVPNHRYSGWSQSFPKGVPPLVLVASFDMPEIVRRLIADGHDVEGKGSDGQTPLIRAAGFGHAANVDVLLEAGAAADACDSGGETALMHAAGNGYDAVVSRLLGYGADVSHRAPDGWTALMTAAMSGSVRVVQRLIEAGAAVNLESNDGDTALSLAARNGDVEIADCLVSAGAIMPNNAAGRRALVIAFNKGLDAHVRRLTGERLSDRGGGARMGALQRGGNIKERFAVLDANLSRNWLGEALEEVIDDEESSDLTATSRPAYVDISEAFQGIHFSTVYRRRYRSGSIIGRGHFATVYTCTDKITGDLYAVKVFERFSGDKMKIKREDMEFIRNEVKLMSTLQHPNIICVRDLIAEDEHIFIVMDLAKRGELFNLIVHRTRFTEPETRKLFSQLFSALKYLHDQNIVHRDVKPENIFCMDDDLSITLGDFGLATYVSPVVGYCDELCGTPSYVAPEILETTEFRRYSFPVDVWSAGVVLYICLCGFTPFSDELYTPESPYTSAQQIKMGHYTYPSPYWDDVGDVALDLIDHMLTVDPNQRYTVQECLQHPWMTMAT